jgi:hypothetical protein
VGKNAKKIMIWLVIAFVAYFLIVQPGQAGNLVTSVLNLLQRAAESVTIFLRNIFA